MTMFTELRPWTAIAMPDDRNYFVQSLILGSRGPHMSSDVLTVRCEAVSNEFLRAENRLDQEREQLLRDLGFREPDPTWWQEIEIARAEDTVSLIQLMTATLEDVFSCGSDVPLDVEFEDPSDLDLDTQVSGAVTVLLSNIRSLALGGSVEHG